MEKEEFLGAEDVSSEELRRIADKSSLERTEREHHIIGSTPNIDLETSSKEEILEYLERNIKAIEELKCLVKKERDEDKRARMGKMLSKFELNLKKDIDAANKIRGISIEK